MNEESYITIVDSASSHKIDVLFQEEVQLDINVPLFYIKSGEEEISHYVEKICKPAVSEFVENQKNNTFKYIDEYTNNTAIKTIELYTDEKTAVIADYATEAENSAQRSAKNASDALSYAEISAEQATIAQNNNKEIENIIDKQSFKYKITNCITEIPQDIKLELNDGTLTLKAGSKVYVPNGKNADGSLKFDEVVIESDVNRLGATARTSMTIVKEYMDSFLSLPLEYCYSGGSAPTSFIYSGYAIWYDTADNVVKYTTDKGNTWISGCSLPLGIQTETISGYASIDQVFNGFGYIGSTVYALPGVKGLIPNGRNADGSLRNIELINSKVLTRTSDSGSYNYSEIAIASNGIGTNDYTYNEQENYVYDRYGSKITDRFPASKITFSKATPYNVISFQPKQPFNAVDHNDSSWIAEQAMPSGKYIDLTLGATGSTYTAPANGWFYVAKVAGASGKLCSLQNQTTRLGSDCWGGSSASWNRCYIPVRKGDIVLVQYDATGDTKFFRFIYAEGEV